MSRLNLLRPAIMLGAIAALVGLSASPGRAEYPDHTVTVIAPFPAGSAVDIVARVISSHLSDQLKQPFVVINQPGADAIIGFDFVAKAKPDGYTMLFSGGAETRLPAMHSKLPFDPIKDITPIALIGDSTHIVGLSAKLGVNSLPEFIALAKKSPGKYNAAVNGNSDRLAVGQLMLLSGVQLVIVNYPGTAEVATSLMGGEADLAIMGGLAFKATLGTNAVKLVASATPTPNPSFPEVPTSAQVGLPTFISGVSHGAYITGGTPPEIVRRLNAEINHALTLPDIATTLTPYGLSLPTLDNSPDAMAKRYVAEIAKWKDVVREAKIPTTD